MTDHFESICSLPPEVRAENQRYAELLLSGQIETHYKRDPKNSLLAKICNWPMPAAAAQPNTQNQPEPNEPNQTQNEPENQNH